MRIYLLSIKSLLLLAASLFLGCSDILETEISGEEVRLLAPQDSVFLAGNEVGFSWDPIKGAAAYHLQIAHPSFAEAQRIVYDTLTPSTTFAAPLEYGWFEWRIRGENSAYVTEYKYATFRLDSSNNIEDYRVVLSEPADAYRTKSNKLSFRWEPLELADYYIFDLKGTDTSIFQRMEGTELEVSLAAENEDFTWQVLAREEESGRTASSVSRKVFIDNTPPVVPATLSPKENESFGSNTSITFEWEAVVDTDKDFKEYILLIYRSANQTTPFYRKAYTNTSVALFGAEEKLEAGDYLWEIQTVDKLGNLSPIGSKLMPFTVTSL